jgi:PKHD-type hydroxylase
VLLQIPTVLSDLDLQSVRQLLSHAKFVDGKLSAGSAARRVKRNQEVSRDAEEIQALNELVMGKLVRHPMYLNGALPHRVAVPYYARYTPGMAYGDHVDDPVMGPGPRYRSDVAITVFLSEPEAYDGGELIVRTSFGEHKAKLPAGDAVMYPASSLHRVAEVTRGERLVAVTWVQSLIRDAAKRELLYELGLVRDRLLQASPDAEETAKINNVYSNLVRMWAEV